MPALAFQPANLLQSVFDNVRVSLAVIDNGGTVVFAEPGFPQHVWRASRMEPDAPSRLGARLADSRLSVSG